MEPATEYEVAKAVSASVSAAMLNQIVAQLVSDENMVIIYKAPEKEGIAHPAEADFLNALKEVEESEIKANEAGNFDKPLLDASALKGSPVKKEKKTIYGATEWTLKNGLKVVFLPTEYEKDEVAHAALHGRRPLADCHRRPAVVRGQRIRDVHA